MPLLLISGLPASGKSTIVARIMDYFKSRDYRNAIAVIDDACNPAFSRLIYNDSHKVSLCTSRMSIAHIVFREREHRGVLRSLVQRDLSKHCLVICDSTNYVKGIARWTGHRQCRSTGDSSQLVEDFAMNCSASRNSCKRHMPLCYAQLVAMTACVIGSMRKERTRVRGEREIARFPL